MTTTKTDEHRECANCGTHGSIFLFAKQVDAEIDWECPKCGMTEEPDPERFETFMERIAERVGGQMDNVFHTDMGVCVFMTPDGYDGLHVLFSPDDMGPDDPTGTWVASAYDENDHNEDCSSGTRIPNTNREFDRIVAWIEGVKAALTAPGYIRMSGEALSHEISNEAVEIDDGEPMVKKITLTEDDVRLVTEVCVFKADKYGWYVLPHPMVKAAADVWASTNLDMPVENYRYKD